MLLSSAKSLVGDLVCMLFRSLAPKPHSGVALPQQGGRPLITLSVIRAARALLTSPVSTANHTPVPVQHRRLYRATTKKTICKAKNAYRAWLASRNSILSSQETIQGKYNQYMLAEATASRLTKQDDRLRWRSHCTRIDNLLADGCAKQAWNAAKRMACASGHSCRSSNPIRNEEGVLQFQPISICNTLRSHYMRLAEAGEGHSLDPTHWETMPQPPQHIPSSSTLSMDLPFSVRELRPCT
ncbi:hypothetical protein BASA83_002818 [Batrachochytrium salamandrivorans]|nr:hypothetical protein BASA83_002818 [Batrachochytrium salamandrivorans]